MQRDELSLTVGLGTGWESVIRVAQILLTGADTFQKDYTRSIFPTIFSVILALHSAQSPSRKPGFAIPIIFLLPANSNVALCQSVLCITPAFPLQHLIHVSK